MICVFDASALLAVLFDEPGADNVLAADGFISAVNFSEALAKAADRGFDPGKVREQLLRLVISIVPFDDVQAVRAAELRLATRHSRLSLADRACIACASQLGLPVLTADRIWSRLDLGLDIRLIR